MKQEIFDCKNQNILLLEERDAQLTRLAAKNTQLERELDSYNRNVQSATQLNSEVLSHETIMAVEHAKNESSALGIRLARAQKELRANLDSARLNSSRPNSFAPSLANSRPSSVVHERLSGTVLRGTTSNMVAPSSSPSSRNLNFSVRQNGPTEIKEFDTFDNSKRNLNINENNVQREELHQTAYPLHSYLCQDLHTSSYAASSKYQNNHNINSIHGTKSDHFTVSNSQNPAMPSPKENNFDEESTSESSDSEPFSYNLTPKSAYQSRFKNESNQFVVPTARTSKKQSSRMYATDSMSLCRSHSATLPRSRPPSTTPQTSRGIFASRRSSSLKHLGHPPPASPVTNEYFPEGNHKMIIRRSNSSASLLNSHNGQNSHSRSTLMLNPHHQEAMAAVEKATSLQEKLSSAHNELRSLRGLLARSKERCTVAETDNTILKAKFVESEASNKELLEAGNRSKMLEVHLSRLKTELAIAKNSESSAKSQLLTIESLAEGDRKELMSIKEKWEILKDEHEKLKLDFRDATILREEVVELRAMNGSLLADNQHFRRDADGLGRECNVIKSKLKVIDEENGTLRIENRKLIDEIGNLDGKLEIMKRSSDILNAKLRNLEKEKAKVQKELVQQIESQKNSKLSSSQSQLDLADHVSIATNLRLQLDAMKKAKLAIQKDAKTREGELESEIETLKEKINSLEDDADNSSRLTKAVLSESGTLIRAVASLCHVVPSNQSLKPRVGSSISRSGKNEQPGTHNADYLSTSVLSSFTLSEALQWSSEVVKQPTAVAEKLSRLVAVATKTVDEVRSWTVTARTSLENSAVPSSSHKTGSSRSHIVDVDNQTQLLEEHTSTITELKATIDLMSSRFKKEREDLMSVIDSLKEETNQLMKRLHGKEIESEQMFSQQEEFIKSQMESQIDDWRSHADREASRARTAIEEKDKRMEEIVYLQTSLRTTQDALKILEEKHRTLEAEHRGQLDQMTAASHNSASNLREDVRQLEAKLGAEKSRYRDLKERMDNSLEDLRSMNKDLQLNQARLEEQKQQLEVIVSERDSSLEDLSSLVSLQQSHLDRMIGFVGVQAAEEILDAYISKRDEDDEETGQTNIQQKDTIKPVEVRNHLEQHRQVSSAGIPSNPMNYFKFETGTDKMSSKSKEIPFTTNNTDTEDDANFRNSDIQESVNQSNHKTLPLNYHSKNSVSNDSKSEHVQLSSITKSSHDPQSPSFTVKKSIVQGNYVHNNEKKTVGKIENNDLLFFNSTDMSAPPILVDSSRSANENHRYASPHSKKITPASSTPDTTNNSLNRITQITNPANKPVSRLSNNSPAAAASAPAAESPVQSASPALHSFSSRPPMPRYPNSTILVNRFVPQQSPVSNSNSATLQKSTPNVNVTMPVSSARNTSNNLQTVQQLDRQQLYSNRAQPVTSDVSQFSSNATSTQMGSVNEGPLNINKIPSIGSISFSQYTGNGQSSVPTSYPSMRSAGAATTVTAPGKRVDKMDSHILVSNSQQSASSPHSTIAVAAAGGRSFSPNPPSVSRNFPLIKLGGNNESSRTSIGNRTTTFMTSTTSRASTACAEVPMASDELNVSSHDKKSAHGIPQRSSVNVWQSIRDQAS